MGVSAPHPPPPHPAQLALSGQRCACVENKAGGMWEGELHWAGSDGFLFAQPSGDADVCERLLTRHPPECTLSAVPLAHAAYLPTLSLPPTPLFFSSPPDIPTLTVPPPPPPPPSPLSRASFLQYFSSSSQCSSRPGTFMPLPPPPTPFPHCTIYPERCRISVGAYLYNVISLAALRCSRILYMFVGPIGVGAL